jgi:hypothetical protein
MDISDFYAEAEKRGFKNNSTQAMLIDSLKKEKKWAVWILFYNNKAVGSVAAHSFDEMGRNSYRIAARTCAFTDLLPYNALRTRNQIVTHQHVTSQFLIPTCIDWVPEGSNLYITSNENDVGSQKLVHRIFAPSMCSTGQMKFVKNLFYRGSYQTVWQLFPDIFLQELKKYPRW